jgi:hypothetical protein
MLVGLVIYYASQQFSNFAATDGPGTVPLEVDGLDRA